MAEKYCGAQAWQTFTFNGLMNSYVYKHPTITCGLPTGHEKDHKGFMWVHTPAGDVKALVAW